VTLKAGEDSPVGLKVEGFNRALGRYVGGEEDGLYFSITLKSDTILRDLFFRPLAGIDGEELAKILGIKGSIQLEHSSLNTSLVQGWNYLQGLPREDCLAINKGSVFLYKTRDVDREELLEKLAVLERTGVGLRREEGFGKLSVCDSFHWESEQW
jgi:CRISPR-associated Csx10 family RAMP protein